MCQTSEFWDQILVSIAKEKTGEVWGEAAGSWLVGFHLEEFWKGAVAEAVGNALMGG